MKKYLYKKILRKPSTEVEFFEEYLARSGEQDKRARFLAMLDQLRTIYRCNASYQEQNTATEQTVLAEYSEQELDHIIRQSRRFSEDCMEIHSEWVRHVMENNIYYSTTVREIAQ